MASTDDDREGAPLTFEKEEEDRDYDMASAEQEAPLPLTVTSRVLYMLGDITAGSAFRFAQWLELVRKRSGKYRASGFPHRLHHAESLPMSVDEQNIDSKATLPDHVPEISLWERLGKAEMLNIESSSFSWGTLSSLHHTEHSSSTDQSEDEMNKALEVTVNSGGVVFFALFNQGESDGSSKEAAAVIKFSSSRMATQSERLGYEFAKWLGVQTPQCRVIHNASSEWLQIKDAVENAKGDEIGEMTCSELLEALELSRCLMFMNYVHGSPLLESSSAFESRENAEKTAAALGRILMLDLVIRNEDRLPCRRLRWRGNSANLILADKLSDPSVDAFEVAFDSAMMKYRPKVIRALKRERRSTSISHQPALLSQNSDLSDLSESPLSSNASVRSLSLSGSDMNIVAIDSVVPRRPPAGKRTNDRTNYPKLVELLINSPGYASELLSEITGGKLGSENFEGGSGLSESETCYSSSSAVVHAFRSGFRAALRDLQGFHIFLITLHQKLDGHLRSFLGIINKCSSSSSSSVDPEKEDLLISDSPVLSRGGFDNDSELQKTGTMKSSLRESTDNFSPVSCENWHGKSSGSNKGSAEQLRAFRLTHKIREFHRNAKVDAELKKEIEQWNEMLKNDAIRLCLENNFTTGFFEGSDSNHVIDAYELKVRLEHILERIGLISDAANTEKPSRISDYMFIGGALAARSVYTLQLLGITHILCLCSNEIGQADAQFPDLFEYKNFSITDEEDADIRDIFQEAHDFIHQVEQINGKVLVHCFEGKSRSATLVLSYLMLRKGFRMAEAWKALKRAHRRAQPNDGFARILLSLDEKLHGKASMEWQQRRPTMKVCPICGKNAGLSSSSLKLHLQKAHKKLSSGSVDSAMNMEIQKALDALGLRSS